jgi:restriction endonuclease Mrr
MSVVRDASPPAVGPFTVEHDLALESLKRRGTAAAGNAHTERILADLAAVGFARKEGSAYVYTDPSTRPAQSMADKSTSSKPSAAKSLEGWAALLIHFFYVSLLLLGFISSATAIVATIYWLVVGITLLAIVFIGYLQYQNEPKRRLAKEQAEEAERKKREYEAWMQSPQGRAWQQQDRERARREKEEQECRRREAEELAERRRKEAEELAARAKWRQYHESKTMDEVSRMSGREFEEFLARLFSRMGYTDIALTPVNDQGGDLVCRSPSGVRIVIQAKRWKDRVGNEAVMQLLGAMRHYRCAEGMVVTNSTFTEAARELAQKGSEITLCDGKWLEAQIKKVLPPVIPEFSWDEYNALLKGWQPPRAGGGTLRAVARVDAVGIDGLTSRSLTQVRRLVPSRSPNQYHLGSVARQQYRLGRAGARSRLQDCHPTRRPSMSGWPRLRVRVLAVLVRARVGLWPHLVTSKGRPIGLASTRVGSGRWRAASHPAWWRAGEDSTIGVRGTADSTTERPSLPGPSARNLGEASGQACPPRGCTMSAGHAKDIFDPRSSPDWDAPPWLSRFVRAELRPWLVQHRQAALDGLGCWLARYSEQQGAKADFVARQNEYLRRLTNEWQSRVDQWRKERKRHDRRGLRNLERAWRARKPPGDDWDWRESWIDPADRRLKPALGYVPPELSRDSQSFVDDLPLPPPPNRDLRPDECWTALLAVHDEVRHPADRISPTDGIPRPLCWRVRELTEEQRPDLRAMQTAVTAAAPPAGGAAGSGTGAAALSDTAPVNGAGEPNDGKPLKEPPPETFAAYRISRGTGSTQATIAEQLSREFGRPIHQGNVSRWLRQVTKWLEDGNVLPPMPEPMKRKPMPMDPERIDLGQNQERRPRHQRHRRTSDDD